MESLAHYSSPAHAVSLLGVLNEQRLKAHLCDVVLMVGEHRYPAHRSVLAASSEYFSTLFSRRDAENHGVIHLDFCEPEAFEMVLNYIYSSSLFVDRGSLAVVQELGYSLGIPFLTNIMSARPQASYCVSRKKLCFSEEDDGGLQKRSVIVHQGGDAFPKRPPENVPPGSGQTLRPSGYSRPNQSGTKLSRNATEEPERERKAIVPSILKGCPEYRPPSVRPQLTSSVSFSETIQHLNSDSLDDPADEVKPEPLYHPKNVSGSQRGPHNQTVDRSGPLIKSLLRRSLSMDSPVPVFSPVLELKDSQTKEHSALKSLKTEEALSAESRHRMPPLVLRSVPLKENKDAQEDAPAIKREASSPLADPAEIIRITVEDNLPVSFEDFQANYDESPRAFFGPSAKRKAILDDTLNLFKRSSVLNEHQVSQEDSVDSMSNDAPQNLTVNADQELGELKSTKAFKCWSCMKVFRSNAGLYRHVNMYHNPEKPYSCEICHKRFHTNFKVWTHCQTQHGVVQNPAASPGSYPVLDEKFQRKLIDIVREREIKKALIMKLRRNKQGHQGQAFGKKSRRSRSYGCPYCGKTFYFQSHLKLHIKGHAVERANADAQEAEDLRKRQYQPGNQVEESQDKDVFPCRLCNEKLSSPEELEEHERACRYATVCPYCGLRFSNSLVKKDHEINCKFKKLTCLKCMRTFRSSFSIWRHQVEVHNQNMMTAREQLTFGCPDANQELMDHGRASPPSKEPAYVGKRNEASYGDSDDSSCAPEDLSSHGKLVVKEEPQEEPVTDQEPPASDEPGVWPCEKCSKLFSSRKTLERHQELLCHIKPFICHICHKAFRTNFRLWSHYQSHTEDPISRQTERRPSSPSPSPPLTISIPEPTTPQASTPKPVQTVNAVSQEEPGTVRSSQPNPNQPEQEQPENGAEDLSCSRSDGADQPASSQESDAFFYHAPTLSALTFKRQYMCKLCYRTFKTAFSLWSHEQSHGHV
ncbi:zinc finger and BTB domain-containing protein 21 [Trichomycterus rosablanca]|uniref:zinc finger and BTB domain-containing protein 21 n=1 Tax=Trichomycterus rosablanca TaxID=2290929 RepID=UPI002F35CF93